MVSTKKGGERQKSINKKRKRESWPAINSAQSLANPVADPREGPPYF